MIQVELQFHLHHDHLFYCYFLCSHDSLAQQAVGHRLWCQPLPPAVIVRPRCQLHPLLLVPCVDMMIGFVPHHHTQNTSCCQNRHTAVPVFKLGDTNRVYDRLFKYECLSPKGLKMLQSGEFTAHRNCSESTRFLTAVLDKWRNIWYYDKWCWSKHTVIR